MDGHAKEMTVGGEQLRKLPSGKSYLRCEKCQQEVRAEAYLTEDEWEMEELRAEVIELKACLLYTSPSPRDVEESRMPSSA